MNVILVEMEGRRRTPRSRRRWLDPPSTFLRGPIDVSPSVGPPINGRRSLDPPSTFSSGFLLPFPLFLVTKKS
jgi:hypothetical protein